MWFLSRVVGLYRLVLDATKEFFIRILMGILIFLGYVLLSLFIYAVMRRIMVPQKVHVLPVHLQYSSRCLMSQSPAEAALCSFPQADFLLNDGKKLLRSGQYYRVALDIEIPENQLNLDAGVFMVNLTFYSTQNRFIATSARPTTIRYRSFLLRTASTILFALPLLFGLWEQKQMLELVLFDSYYEPYGDGALSAKLFLESNKVHVYSTTLSVDANFSGFTYYLYQWPISMSVIVVISILITLCTCTVLIWMRDVLNDFEERRAMRLQRGRGGAQQRNTTHRSIEQRRGHRVPETVSAAERSGHSSEATETTGDEDFDQRAEVDISGTVTPAGTTREGSEVRDTEGSEGSGGLGDIISNLQSLRRDLDNEESSDHSSIREGVGQPGDATGVVVGQPGNATGLGAGQPADETELEARASETGELRRTYSSDVMMS